MAKTSRFVSILSLVVPLLISTALAAQQDDKNGVRLTVEPARMTIHTGQTQRFSAHVEGEPAGTVIKWVIPDKDRDVSSISQDGVFTARVVGVYRVIAVAIVGQDTVLKTAVAKVTVLGKSEY
jgi:hypothetical protein